MYTTQSNRQIEREEEEEGTRQMYTTENNRQIERQFDREEEEEVDTDRCIQHRTIDRERGGGDNSIDREIIQQMYTTQNNRQRVIVTQSND